MPMYEFECCSCQESFERLVRNDRELAETTCPNCQGQEVNRLLSVPAKPVSSVDSLPMNCRGDGPPCGAMGCPRPAM